MKEIKEETSNERKKKGRKEISEDGKKERKKEGFMFG